MTISAMSMAPMLDRGRATLCKGEERQHCDSDLLLHIHYGAVELQDHPRSANDARSTSEQMMMYEKANDEDWSSASEGEQQSWIRSALHECEHKALTLDPTYEIEPKAFLQSYALLAKAPRLRMDSVVSTSDIIASDRSPSRWSSAETPPTSISSSDGEQYSEPAITLSTRAICRGRTFQRQKKRESISDPSEEGDSSDFSSDQPPSIHRKLERRESDVRKEQPGWLPIGISNSSSTSKLRRTSQPVLNGQQCCHCCHNDNSSPKQPKCRLQSMEERHSCKKIYQAKLRTNRKEKIVMPLAGQSCAIDFNLVAPTKHVPYSKKTFGKAAGFMRDTFSSKNRSCSGGAANSSSGSSSGNNGSNPTSVLYGYRHIPGAHFANSCTRTTGSFPKTKSRRETARIRRASARLDRRRQRTAGPRLYKSVSGGEVLETTDSSSTLVTSPNLPVRRSARRKVKAARQAPETVASIETLNDSISHACPNSLSFANSRESVRMRLHQRQRRRQSTASEANNNIGCTTLNPRIADQTSRDVDGSSHSGCFSVDASLPHRDTATQRDMGGDESERDTTFIDVDKRDLRSNQRDDLSTNCFLSGEAVEYGRRPNRQAKSEEPEEAAGAAGVACACTKSERSVAHLAAQIKALRLELSRLTLHCEYQLMSLHQKFDSNMKKSEKLEN